MTYPSISCMCLTFARPKRIVEEAVYSFLNQDYPGDKELLILNDFDQQIIRFDHPQVTIVNISSRFRTVGEKRNAAAALCRHDLLAVWDDDFTGILLNDRSRSQGTNFGHVDHGSGACSTWCCPSSTVRSRSR